MLEKLQRAFANSVVTRSSAPLSSWCELVPTWRLSIYQDNYHQSLLTTLQQIFSYSRQLIGKKHFEQFSQGYVAQYPSMHPDLNEYGEFVPSFLGHYLINQGLAESLAYVPDVARLDRLLHKVYYAPNAPLFDGPPLSQRPTTKQMQQRFQRSPSIQLLQSLWPLNKLQNLTPSQQKDLTHTSWQQLKESAHFVIYRHEGKPKFAGVSKLCFELLALLATPCALEDICLDHPELTAEFLEAYTLGWVHQLA